MGIVLPAPARFRAVDGAVDCQIVETADPVAAGVFAHPAATQGNLRLVDLDVMDGVEATVSVAIRTAIRGPLRSIVGFIDISRGLP